MAEFSFYQLLWFFFIYGFLGWCTEVCFQALSKGKWVNRGFLNGAICPIYGIGVVIVVEFLDPLASYGVILFVGAVILCSILELITGFLLEKIFHQRWWDYSGEPLNIGGYVCIKFSLAWGLACVFIVRLIHPTVMWAVDIIPHTVGIIILCALGAGLLTDIAATSKIMIGFNRTLRSIDEGAAKIREISDDITDVLYETSMKTKEELEKKKAEGEIIKAKAKERKEKAEAYKEAYKKELVQKLTRGQRRILKAFPNIKSIKHTEAMEEMKKRLEVYKQYKNK